MVSRFYLCSLLFFQVLVSCRVGGEEFDILKEFKTLELRIQQLEYKNWRLQEELNERKDNEKRLEKKLHELSENAKKRGKITRSLNIGCKGIERISVYVRSRIGTGVYLLHNDRKVSLEMFKVQPQIVTSINTDISNERHILNCIYLISYIRTNNKSKHCGTKAICFLRDKQIRVCTVFHSAKLYRHISRWSKWTCSSFRIS